MKDNKTKITDVTVEEYISSLDNEVRREEAGQLVNIMKQATGDQPKMWGPSIIGFGTHHYVYESGREGETLAVGFSPRKPAIVLYGLFHYEHGVENAELASKLGTHTNGKGCVYVKKLTDIDTSVLKRMLKNTYHARNNVV